MPRACCDADRGCRAGIAGLRADLRSRRDGSLSAGPRGPSRSTASLSDEGWRDATRIEQWYEIDPGDNIEPTVKNVGVSDVRRSSFSTRPSSSTIRIRKAIRAPFGDHDTLMGNGTDYGGIFLDPGTTGRTAYEFLVDRAQHPVRRGDRRRIGENSSPDFFWESAARDPRPRLDGRDAHPVFVAALQERRSPDVGHHPATATTRAIPLSDSCRRSMPRGGQLLRLPRTIADRVERLPRAGISSRRRTSSGSEVAHAPGGARHAARRTIRSTARSAST